MLPPTSPNLACGFNEMVGQNASRSKRCRGVEGRWEGLSFGEDNWLYCVTRGYHPLILLLSLLFVNALRPTVWTESITVVQGRE